MPESIEQVGEGLEHGAIGFIVRRRTAVLRRIRAESDSAERDGRNPGQDKANRAWGKPPRGRSCQGNAAVADQPRSIREIGDFGNRPGGLTTNSSGLLQARLTCKPGRPGTCTGRAAAHLCKPGKGRNLTAGRRKEAAPPESGAAVGLAIRPDRNDRRSSPWSRRRRNPARISPGYRPGHRPRRRNAAPSWSRARDPPG